MDRDTSFVGISSEQIGENYFLIGLISRFNNSFQATADALFEELSWKQVFSMNCVALFPEAPTIKDMANLLGCSHQNAKQVLSKLESTGYLQFQQDTTDKRKQRLVLTEKAMLFRNQYELASEQAMQKLFATIPDDAISTTVQTFMQLIRNIEKIKGEEHEDNRSL
ncbi:MarR family winged helix-turn-helix transcriptional regulator [Adlercreutzia sp. ZJ141]|uniref:MarR family winged helix-turn-helix transcriptional regulator n=1 Tax=Adlercreutzia sp. ZJ141 TaxID=2709406 RepID=UPI0013EC7CA5|nr:SgrR family transcriptional regulator [Adlercreutzia sp. ZJ141]